MAIDISASITDYKNTRLKDFILSSSDVHDIQEFWIFLKSFCGNINVS